MKLFITVFIAAFIAIVYSQKTSNNQGNSDFRKMVRDASEFVNNFNGTIAQFQAAVKSKCLNAGNFTPDQAKRFLNAVCKKVKNDSNYSCDDFKAAAAQCQQKIE